MVQVKLNYKNNNINNLSCPCCLKEDNNQDHIISCEKLTNLKVTKLEYDSMFGGCDEKMSKMIGKMEILMSQRNFILESNK